MRRLFSFAFAASCLVLALESTRADEAAYYNVRIADLTLTQGKFEGRPTAPDREPWRWYAFHRRPIIRVEKGEAYWQTSNPTDVSLLNLDQWGNVAVRLPDGPAEVVGRIDYPRDDALGYSTVHFRIAADQAKPAARTDFLNAKLQHYERLVNDNAAGGAWFRHQVRRTQIELKDGRVATVPSTQPDWRRADDLDDTFSLFAGTRAVSENLQLERALPPVQAGDRSVALNEIEGITTSEIDWKPLLEGKKPTLDPLAAYVPADQHVVFFPTFSAAMTLADEAEAQGTALVHAAEPQSQDARVVDRYQRQIGLRTTALGRLLGPSVIKSLALTGGDPYFRMGTDLALVFEAVDVPTLRTALIGQITLNTANEKQVTHRRDVIRLLDVEVPYESWTTADRTVNCYLASYGDVVVVTNSLPQLRRLALTHQRQMPSIASLDEYKFFRDRYQVGADGETAFLFLSDATIRRWCGPKWRIADSRRVRDLAVLAEWQALSVPKLATNTVEPSAILISDPTLSLDGELRLTADGVRSSKLGSLEFMTPIGEMEFTKVTEAEEAAYTRWKTGYQSNFSWAFDPIGLRFTVNDERLAADLTVMPLIDNSDYDEYIAVSRGVQLKPESGDPHDAPLHAVLALNTNSPTVRQYAAFAAFFAPQMKVDLLSWIGDSVAVYADNSPFWDELAKLQTDAERQKFFTDEGHRTPVAVRIEVSSAFKATAFLAAARAYIDQSGPGMVNWENLKHGEADYVKISPTAKAIRPGQPGDKFAVYYALTAEALTISLSEDVVKGSLDRDAARAAGGDAQPAVDKAPWLGENLCVDAGARAVQMYAAAMSAGYQGYMQRLSWSNQPILNEWHRLFPEVKDDVALHERLWGTRLICPGGGEYVWNETWQTYESTVYGHPAEPKPGPAVPPQLSAFSRMRYGLTFEEHGLRAKAELQKAKKTE